MLLRAVGYVCRIRAKPGKLENPSLRLRILSEKMEVFSAPTDTQANFNKFCMANSRSNSWTAHHDEWTSNASVPAPGKHAQQQSLAHQRSMHDS